jgi:hypothetical protein
MIKYCTCIPLNFNIIAIMTCVALRNLHLPLRRIDPATATEGIESLAESDSVTWPEIWDSMAANYAHN